MQPAVSLLLQSIIRNFRPQINFKLVQCSTYNTTNRARIAAKAMYDLKRFDVPVAVGLYTGEDGMFSYDAFLGDGARPAAPPRRRRRAARAR